MFIKELCNIKAVFECDTYKFSNDNERMALIAYIYIVHAGAMFKEHIKRTVEDTNTSFGQFTVLMILSSLGRPVSIGRLAKMAGVSIATISSVLTAMHHSGLVKRVPDDMDKRIVRIELLPQGQKILDAVIPCLVSHGVMAMSELNHPDNKMIVDVFQKLIACQ